MEVLENAQTDITRTPLRALVRGFILRSYLATCAAVAVKNGIERLRFRLGRIDTASGTLHSSFSLDGSIDYIEAVFRDYKKYGGLSCFHGRVAEIGPGDNCGVGMLFRGDGSEQVDLVDRFYSHRDSARQAKIYEALLAREPVLRELFGTSDVTDETSFAGLQRHYGQSASAEEFFITNRGYDFIVSRAVGEHLYDPIAAMRGMIGALNPGGVLLHKIDLRDHQLFSNRHHELKWLEVPDWVYRQMSSGSGRPNRVLAHEYRAVLAQSGIEHTVLITGLAGVGEITPHVPYEQIDQQLRRKAERYVESIRPRLARSLRDVASRDLATVGIFIVARRAPAS